MSAALPDGRLTASTLIDLNERRTEPPAFVIAAMSAAVGAWSYPTSRSCFDGADVAADAPTASAIALTASAAMKAFTEAPPSWNSDLVPRPTPSADARA